MPSNVAWTTVGGTLQTPLLYCAGNAAPVSAADSSHAISVPGHGVAVLSDTAVSFALPTLTRVYLSAALHVWVAGQETASVTVVPFLAPTIQSLSFSTRLPNATNYFVTIVGANFGSSLQPSQCTADGGVVVTVNDQPCAALEMLTVRKRRYESSSERMTVFLCRSNHVRIRVER